MKRLGLLCTRLVCGISKTDLSDIDKGDKSIIGGKMIFLTK